MKLSTEEDLQQFFAYQGSLNESGFVESVQIKLQERKKIRQRIILAATTAAIMVALAVAMLAGYEVWQPVIDFALKNSYVFITVIALSVLGTLYLKPNKV